MNPNVSPSGSKKSRKQTSEAQVATLPSTASLRIHGAPDHVVHALWRETLRFIRRTVRSVRISVALNAFAVVLVEDDRIITYGGILFV